MFAKLDPAAFAQAFGQWMAAACEATGLIPVAIDGKSARSAKRSTATGCLHVVTAWAAENRLVLGAASVADGSNEIAAIPELLRALDLAGAIVTINAAGCQLENARIIREEEGHYLLAVKDNQPTLRAAVEAVFDRACDADFIGVRSDGHEEVGDGHGRHEERYVTVVYEPSGLPTDWPDVAAVILVNREREVGGERTCTSHYYLTSYAGTAAEFARGVRGHWEYRDPPARLPAKRYLVRRRMGRIPSPRRPCSRWPRGLTNETNTEGIHAHPRTDPRPPPSPPPGPLTAIWAQLPTDRRRRLQRLLAELLARPVTVAAALPREGRHDHRTA